MGTAPFFPAVSATISKWFDKKRGLALGIATSGTRSGQAVFAPLAAFLITTFSWRPAYLITGILAWLIVIPLSGFMKKDPRDVGALPDGYEGNPETLNNPGDTDTREIKGLKLSQAIKRRSYWYIMPTWLFVGFASMMVYTHVIPYAIDLNIDPMRASTILTIIGVVALPAGILIGRFVDVTGAKIPLVICCLLLAGALLSFLWVKDLWNFYLVAAVIGLCNAGIAITIVALTVDAFGKRHIGTIMASLDSCHGIGSEIGPLAGGLVFDIYGSYDLAFLFSAVGLVISSLFLLLFKTGRSQEMVNSYDT
jgi:MFS family permease